MSDAASELNIEPPWSIPTIEEFLKPTPEMSAEAVRIHVDRRLRRPAVFQTARIFNFSDRPFHEDALFRVLNKLDDDVYVIPSPNSMLWGFMRSLLPEELAEAPYLIYLNDYDRYRQLPNYSGQLSRSEVGEIKADLCNLIDRRYPSIRGGEKDGDRYEP